MTVIFVAVVVIASILLGAIVLIQSPKGGGLASNIAGFSNQFMGVKQTTDLLEKGTWILSGVLVILCMVSVLIIKSGKGSSSDVLKNIPTTGAPAAQPAPAPQPAPAAGNTPQ